MDANESNDTYNASGSDENGESDSDNNERNNSSYEDNPSDGDHCSNVDSDGDENTDDIIVEDYDDNRINGQDDDDGVGNYENGDETPCDDNANATVSTCRSAALSVNTADQTVEAEVNVLCMPSSQMESVRKSNPSWKRKHNKGPQPYGKNWAKSSNNDKRCYNVQINSGNRAVDKGKNDNVGTAQGNPSYVTGNKSSKQHTRGKGCQGYNNKGKFHERVGMQNSLLCNDGRGTSPNEGKMLVNNYSRNQGSDPTLDYKNTQNHGSSNKNKSIGNSNKTNMSSNNQNYNKNNNYHNSNKNSNNNNNSSNSSKSNNNNNNKNSSSNNCNKTNSYKKSDEHSKDLIRLARDIISPFWKKKDQPEPVDSIVLKLHYRLSVCLFLIFFTFVQSNWYLKESIECISGHNPNIDIEFRLKNFCLSYSYICEFDAGQCTRRYILFYRWIYMCFLLVAPLYYMPRFVAKKVMNPRLKKLLLDLARDEERYDDSTWEADSQKMLMYMLSHKERNSQYIWLILCHGIALGIDVAVVVFFDFLLHNRFLGFLYSAYPYHRNLPYFTDYISQTFPPVVNCTVHIGNLINNYREETFGCYLYLMELYDKVFVVTWVWLAFLILFTALYVFMLLVLACPPFNRLFLHLYTTSEGVHKLKCKVFKMCSLSDLYALHLMKNHRSEGQFIHFLSKFVHNYEDSLQEVIVGSGQGTPDDKQKYRNVEDLQLNVGKENWEPRLIEPLMPSAPVYSISTQCPPIGFHPDICKNDVRVRKPSNSSPKKKAPPPPPCRFSLSKMKRELQPIPEDS